MMNKYDIFFLPAVLILALLTASPAFSGADSGAGTGAAAAATASQSSAAAGAADAAASASASAAEGSAAAAAAASAPGVAADGLSDAEMQGCLTGNEENCKALFAIVMKNLNKIITSSYRMTHSLHVFNPNAVRYSMAKAQMLTRAILPKK